MNIKLLLASALVTLGLSACFEQEPKKIQDPTIGPDTIEQPSDVGHDASSDAINQRLIEAAQKKAAEDLAAIEEARLREEARIAEEALAKAAAEAAAKAEADRIAALPKLPTRAYALMPVVAQAIDDIWPDMPMRSYFPAQIEAESCISLTHSKCWNPSAELKTSREYGFGLGQITIAYRADGSERFNVFEEAKRQHPDLRNWEWADRYNPLLQIKAIVVKNYVNWRAITWPVHDLDNKMAFLATYYNGGSPAGDRRICVNTPGCDPSRWWGNVERYSSKSKTKLKEYGNRSLFEISREYPRKVLIDRRPKYIPHIEV